VTKQATCKEAGSKIYTCTICGGTKTETIAKLTTHTYDKACDTTCNVCGGSRTVSHQYSAEWVTTKTNHWHECSLCGDKKGLSAHTPGAAATETSAQTCTTCGYIIAPTLNHTHNYSMLPPNPYHTSTILTKKADMLDNKTILSDTVRIN
jgi:hypothetical protein